MFPHADAPQTGEPPVAPRPDASQPGTSQPDTSQPDTSLPDTLLPGAMPLGVPATPSSSSPVAPTPTSTLGYWQLTRGRLRAFEIPWSDARDGFERLLRALHGEKDLTLGVERDGLCVTVYRCRRPSSDLSFQFLVTVGNGTQFDKILVEDLPDLLAFLDQLVPIIELAMKTREREEILAARAGAQQQARPSAPASTGASVS